MLKIAVLACLPCSLFMSSVGAAQGVDRADPSARYESIPLDAGVAWQHWDATTLAGAVVEGGEAHLTNEASFVGDRAIALDHDGTGSITLPYPHIGESLRNGATLFGAFHAPNAQSGDAVRVEVLRSGVTPITFELLLDEPVWTRVEFFTDRAAQRFELRVPADAVVTGVMPNLPHSIRITPLSTEPGRLYVGQIFVGADARVAEAQLNADQIEPPIEHAAPVAPGTPSSAELEGLAQVRERFDEILGVAPYTTVASHPTDEIDQLVADAESWNIRSAGGPSAWKGRNPTVYESALDWMPDENIFGRTMFELAQAYRTTLDAEQQARLLSHFQIMLGYSEAVGGVPDRWAGGFYHLPAIWLMREPLGAAGDLTEDLLARYRSRLGFDRIRLDHSYFARTGINGFGYEYPSRSWREGEVGEDVDYHRIIGRQLAMLCAIESDDSVAVRDLHDYSRYLSEFALGLAPGTMDGLRSDGLAFHHWGWVFQYHDDWLARSAELLYVLASSPFALPEDAHRRVTDAVQGQDAFSYRGIVPNHLSGKGGDPYRYGGNNQADIDRYAWCALAGTADRSAPIDPDAAAIALRLRAEYPLGDSEESPFATFALDDLDAQGFSAQDQEPGARIWPYGAFAAHRGSDWMVSVKGYSRFQYTRESDDPWMSFYGYGMLETTRRTWLRYGVLKVDTNLRHGGFDWRRLPGATTVIAPDFGAFRNVEYKRYWSPERFVGGLQDGADGVFAMSLRGSNVNGLGSFRARKSWHFLPGMIVCVGSGITNALDGAETVTTLYQGRVGSGDATFDGSTAPVTGLSTSEDRSLTESAWLVDADSTGFWIPAGSSLSLRRQTQTHPDWLDAVDNTGSFAHAWLRHGSSPSGAAYSYIQRPNESPEGMESFAAAMETPQAPVEILRSTPQCHAVLARGPSATGIVVFDESVPVDIDVVQEVSRPLIMRIRHGDSDQREIALADPNLDLIDHENGGDNESWGVSRDHAVEVQLAGIWSLGAGPASSASIVHDLRARRSVLRVTLSQGATQRLKLIRGLGGQLPQVR
jgi:hypothetical protein